MRHTVLNAEAFTAVIFFLILVLRVKPGIPQSRNLHISDRSLYGLIFGLTLAAFAPALGIPLLHDSYGHIYTATHESFPNVLAKFVSHPTQGDFFFRPLGYLSFWLDGLWAGTWPFSWHAWSLFVHILNSLLVYTLARRLAIGKLGSLIAGLFFALHGSRPEAVAWVAARFDLLAAFFSLLTLLFALNAIETGNKLWLLPVTLCTAAALLSKESAFCLPLLVLGVILLKDVSSRVVGPFTCVLATSVVVFAYRVWVLRGIGGYGAESGSPAILHFSLIRSLNALFFRQWALLFFPVNWSVYPGPALWIGLAAAVAALLIALQYARARRPQLILALAITLAAALPVEHLLLIGTDLSGARVLYLPVLGLSFFWAFVADQTAGRFTPLLLAAMLLVMQTTALEHNLGIWRDVAELSRTSCRFLAAELVHGPLPVAILNAPPTRQGVYFLKNSLPACIVMNSGGRLKRLPKTDSDAASSPRVYQWNDREQRFDRTR